MLIEFTTSKPQKFNIENMCYIETTPKGQTYLRLSKHKKRLKFSTSTIGVPIIKVKICNISDVAVESLEKIIVEWNKLVDDCNH